MTDRPFFSVIMPVYNRAAVVGRSINSCVQQDFESFELVVVDDGSSDGTVDAIRSFKDRRIRLIAHERNRGRGPARNTGMAAARGEWLVFLDSDDELLPDALAAIHRRAIAADPSIGGLRFMCVDEEGISPVPAHRDEIFEYEDYLRWLDVAVKVETLPCARASTFPAVQYPDSHATERSYHLDLARASRVQACTDVVRRYHHDVADRITVTTPERDLRYAPDEADDAREVLRKHGDAMRRFAPRTYWFLLSHATMSSFMAGRRMDGVRYALRAGRITPFAPRLYAITLVGLFGPRRLAQLKNFWRRTRAAA
ncbi:MAG TPA: glycosyltransferase family A protein [Thermoanaerobaculia bacterium]|nr:glycosyltransferase family A protein [Thermoanaerobaculia bacterium]